MRRADDGVGAAAQPRIGAAAGAAGVGLPRVKHSELTLAVWRADDGVGAAALPRTGAAEGAAGVGLPRVTRSE